MSATYIEQRDDVYMVAGTRVSLDSIVYAFLDGQSAEAIAQAFPVLTLEQVYGAIAYYLLTLALVSRHGKDSALAIALGADFKGKISMTIYAVAIPLALASSLAACLLYVLVALMWLVPDRRFEKALAESRG